MKPEHLALQLESWVVANLGQSLIFPLISCPIQLIMLTENELKMSFTEEKQHCRQLITKGLRWSCS